MSKMTILDSRDFWQELKSRSEAADSIAHEYGQVWLRQIVAEAFALKKEYDERTNAYEHASTDRA